MSKKKKKLAHSSHGGPTTFLTFYTYVFSVTASNVVNHQQILSAKTVTVFLLHKSNEPAHLLALWSFWFNLAHAPMLPIPEQILGVKQRCAFLSSCPTFGVFVFEWQVYSGIMAVNPQLALMAKESCAILTLWISRPCTPFLRFVFFIATPHHHSRAIYNRFWIRNKVIISHKANFTTRYTLFAPNPRTHQLPPTSRFWSLRISHNLNPTPSHPFLRFRVSCCGLKHLQSGPICCTYIVRNTTSHNLLYFVNCAATLCS